ncbi:E4 sumo-protein ligase pial2 [Thalictrum thalictroides]|uniref:E4 sumo-protein ligase pial2 n=1 Tax=Thalictrum thalictroides TaxID=46969 RepID=A0A7J6W0Q0_THATH|nr:E4 sumo-protein ligase pial2 [Thalictrum thalictroides]
MVYHRKNEPHLQASVMVLMISVKNACKNHWFLVQDSEELLTLANELGRSFCSPADINIEPSSLPHVIPNILSRFFPRMKIGHVLASLEIKPGFGAFAIDFHILRDKSPSLQEKIRLFVVQTDNIMTSSCLISPQKVNFLLNGKGVDRRIDVSMDSGPQLPTNVTTMLRIGTNLLQAIGYFSGNYIIAIAFMTVMASSDMPALQDYVQPVAAVLESDSEIIEGSSRISLNCPISFTRIKTPVKGQLCKHRQCFDFENYVQINSRRPSWRCPHCNQSVCFLDIRIDQNMVKILGEVAGNVTDVIVSADGSWKPVMESADQTVHHDRTFRQDGLEQCESTRSPATLANVVDLTVEDEENNAMDTCETEDRKPNKDVHPGHPVAGLPVSSEINNTSECSENRFPQVEDEFWQSFFLPCSSNFNGTTAQASLESSATNLMMAPALAVSTALNQDFVDVREASQAGSSMIHAQTLAASNLHLQSSQFENSLITTEFGRSIPRYVNRNPIAVQALPAPSQGISPSNRMRGSISSFMPNGSVASQATPLMPSRIDALSNNSEVERQQQFSRSLLSSSSAPDSPSMMHYSMTQNWDHQGHPYISSPLQQVGGIPAINQVPVSYRGSSGLPTEHHNPYQPPLNVGMPQTIGLQGVMQASTQFLPVQVQHAAQGISGQDAGISASSHSRRMATHHTTQVVRLPPAVPVQLQAPRTGSSAPMTIDGLRQSGGEQRGMSMGSVSRVDASNDLAAEHNWRPTGRMRGSLSGRAYSAALTQFMIQPTQSTQIATLPPPDLTSPLSVSSPLPVLIANNMNSHGPQQQACTRAGHTAGSLGTNQ